ncbi:hypothetical protein [Sporolactobacillus sp. THM19-2]|uniref:hypothetical protein n=1 Tax=Sporolactobacillus sp. THM19-2 TaxID=2511171 RepID=UPI00102109A8|nr:hypothetical protein [Sporolactobacillus sp. THM19-2]RYL92569.1 hypothetical protein EWH91_06820 [Sporolactobacillus sp. THM19-2]
MTKTEVFQLATSIKAMYNYVVLDETYLDIWLMATKHADFQATMQRFCQYISDPKCRHSAPLPADIVVTKKETIDPESEKMQQWEAEAKARPVKHEDFEWMRRQIHG